MCFCTIVLFTYSQSLLGAFNIGIQELKIDLVIYIVGQRIFKCPVLRKKHSALIEVKRKIEV